MKITINGNSLDTISMQFFDYDGGTLSFPEHRVELVETEPVLILAMPEKLVIQLFLNELISRDESKPVQIKIGRKKERKYVFIDAKFQHNNSPFGKHKQVRLFFREINNKKP